MIRKKGSPIPFNIKGFKAVDYDLDMKSVHEAKKRIAEFINKGLEDRNGTDSLVYEVLDDLSVTRDETEPAKSKSLPSDKYVYPLKNSPSKK